MAKTLPIDQIVTPAYQTPEGLLLLMFIGLLVAFGAWRARETIDLLFFRLSGGNRRTKTARPLPNSAGGPRLPATACRRSLGPTCPGCIEGWPQWHIARSYGPQKS